MLMLTFIANLVSQTLLVTLLSLIAAVAIAWSLTLARKRRAWAAPR
jgi:hypothetical protein